MTDNQLTKDQRDKLVAEMNAIFQARYPDEGEFPSDREDNRLRKRYDWLNGSDFFFGRG